MLQVVDHIEEAVDDKVLGPEHVELMELVNVEVDDDHNSMLEGQLELETVEDDDAVAEVDMTVEVDGSVAEFDVTVEPNAQYLEVVGLFCSNVHKAPYQMYPLVANEHRSALIGQEHAHRKTYLA